MVISDKEELQAKEALLAFTALALDASDRYSLDREPTPNSKASDEIQLSAAPRFVEVAYSLGVTALRVSADHALALCRSVSDPRLVYAPFTDARGVLESSSRCAWLIDPSIDFDERAQRAINLLIAEVRGRKRFLEASPGAFGYSPARLAADIAQCDQRINKLKTDAKNLGFIGAGSPVARLPDPMDPALELRSDYSLLSGAAHGEFWALRALAINVQTINNQKVGVGKIPTERVWWLLRMSAEWIVRNIWSWFQLIGWDSQKLLESLDQNPLSFPRFWKK